MSRRSDLLGVLLAQGQLLQLLRDHKERNVDVTTLSVGAPRICRLVLSL